MRVKYFICEWQMKFKNQIKDVLEVFKTKEYDRPLNSKQDYSQQAPLLHPALLTPPWVCHGSVCPAPSPSTAHALTWFHLIIDWTHLHVIGIQSPQLYLSTHLTPVIVRSLKYVMDSTLGIVSLHSSLPTCFTYLQSPSPVVSSSSSSYHPLRCVLTSSWSPSPPFPCKPVMQGK